MEDCNPFWRELKEEYSKAGYYYRFTFTTFQVYVNFSARVSAASIYDARKTNHLLILFAILYVE